MSPRQTMQERKKPCPGTDTHPCGMVAALDVTASASDGVARCIACNVRLIKEAHGIR